MRKGWLTHRQVATLVLIAATTVAFYLSFRIALPFLPAIIWALALAVVVLPVHRKIEALISNRTAAAAISVVLVTVIIITPVAFAGRQIALQVASNTESVRRQIQSGAWREHLRHQHPQIAAMAERLELESNLRSIADNLLGRVPDYTSSFLENSIWMLTQLLVTLFVLFYFFRDRAELLFSARGMIPLKAAEIDKVFGRIRDTIFATVYGRTVSAVLQGALGGLMFWWLGVPGPFLWGVVMAVMGLLPMLGSFIIWIPAAAYLAFSDGWVSALILIGRGGAGGGRAVQL